MARTPIIDAWHTLAVDVIQHACSQSLIKPAIGVSRKRRIDRQALHQIHAGRFGCGFEHAQMRPRGLGIHMVRGHRRHATPIIDTRSNEPAERPRAARFGGAWMFIWGSKIRRAIAIVQR